MSDTEHARFGPSKMQRTIACPGALALEETCPNVTSDFAAEGTAAHQLLEWALSDGKYYTRAYKGRIISWTEGKGVHTKRFEFEADEDMCEYVQQVVDRVLQRAEDYKLLGAVKVTIFAERRVDFGHIVGVPNQFGTSDVIVIAEFADGTARMAVEDLKYGMGVQVWAKDNEQLKTYGLACLDYYSLVYDIELVDLAIHQPRIGHFDEDTVSVEELVTFGDVIHDAVQQALAEAEAFGIHRDAKKLTLVPGEKQCKFCRAKAKCPAIAAAALRKVSDDFDDLDNVKGKVKQAVKDRIDYVDQNTNGVVDLELLAEIYESADLLEDFIKAVRGRIEAELLASGNSAEMQKRLGAKLVEGRKGNRAWTSQSAVEEIMKSMRLKKEEMYSMKLISPAAAEKLLKSNERRWKKLSTMITQPEGQPSIAPISDKRKALVVKTVAEDFDDLDTAPNDADMV